MPRPFCCIFQMFSKTSFRCCAQGIWRPAKIYMSDGSTWLSGQTSVTMARYVGYTMAGGFQCKSAHVRPCWHRQQLCSRIIAHCKNINHRLALKTLPFRRKKGNPFLSNGHRWFRLIEADPNGWRVFFQIHPMISVWSKLRLRYEASFIGEQKKRSVEGSTRGTSNGHRCACSSDRRAGSRPKRSVVLF